MVRRTTIVCLEVLCGIVILAGILGAVTAWRLSQGPLSVGFLLPYAKSIAERTDYPFQAEMEDLILTWPGWGRALDMRATGVTLTDRNTQRAIIRSGEVSLSLSFRALLTGEVALTSIELIRPLISMSRTETGVFQLGFGEADREADDKSENAVGMMLDELSSPSDGSGSFSYLTRASVIGATLRVEDRMLGVSWGARHADITVERAPIGLRATFDLDLGFKGTRPQIEGEAYFDKKNKSVDVAFSFDSVEPAKLAKEMDGLSPLNMLSTKLSGEGHLHFGPDGRVAPSEIKVSGTGGKLTLPGPNASSINFRKFTMEASIRRNPDQITIGNFEIALPNGTATAKGIMTRVGDIGAISATLDVPTLPVNDLKKYWPLGQGGGARAWVTTNLREGTISSATADLTARLQIFGPKAGDFELDSVNGRFSVEGFEVDYLAPLPPITDASATATFSETRFDFAVQKGSVGALSVADGTVNILNIGTPQVDLSVSTLVTGPVKDALAILNHPRLDLLTRVGLQTGKAQGSHATRLQISFPLLDDLRTKDVQISATSNVEGLALNEVIQGQGIKETYMSLELSNDWLHASGSTLFADARTRFLWSEDFSGKAETIRRVEVNLAADKKIREIFDTDYPDILEGPVSLNAVYKEDRTNGKSVKADLNLKDTKISVPGFNWTKPAGQEGKASVTVLLNEGKPVVIPNFDIDAGIFSTVGDLTFHYPPDDPGPSVKTLNLKHFKLGATDFTARAELNAEGAYLVNITGQGFDAAPFVGKNLGGAETLYLPAFSLKGNFQKFWIGPGTPANKAKINLRHDGKRWKRIEADAELPDGGKAIGIKMRPTDTGHKLSIYAADAGVLLKALDVTETIRGGSIEISGTRVGGREAQWNGLAEMKRFRVADAPGLARLLALASLTGITDAISGKGIFFDRLKFPYVFDNETVKISEARAVGSELGITASGSIDLGKDAVDLNGTIVPAYTINSLIGKVPVLGPLLTGEKGSGIFAASYKVKGPIDKPEMTANPLSALAPGFLRKLLGAGGTGVNEGKTPDEEER